MPRYTPNASQNFVFSTNKREVLHTAALQKYLPYCQAQNGTTKHVEIVKWDMEAFQKNQDVIVQLHSQCQCKEKTSFYLTIL